MINDTKQDHIFYRIVNGIIRLLLAGAVFLLFLHSIFSTSFVGRLFLEDGSEQERTLNIADSPLRHLLAFLLLTAAMLAGRKLWDIFGTRNKEYAGARGGKSVEAREKIVFWGLTLLTLILAASYVCLTQFYPGSDPAKVYGIAMQWRQGDFSSFGEDAYLFRYPFQSGIVLFFYLLSFLFGEGNFVGIQLLYAVFLAVIYGLLVKLSGLFGVAAGEGTEGFEKRRTGLQTAVYLGLLVWVPLAFYVTYLYGILPGMALSLGAVYFAQRYLAHRRLRYVAAASLCMGFATVIKMNCLIYLIAIACFLVYDAISKFFFSEKKRWKEGVLSLVFIACMGVSVAVCTGVSNAAVERIAGRELPEGEAMLSWVVMGMQEAPLGPGGYNGYISNVFAENHFNQELAAQASMEELQKILTRMLEYPVDEGIPFLARKTAFQWNDPTFICLDRTRGRKSETHVPEWLTSVIYGRGSVRLSIALNYMQTWILLGMLLCLFLRWRKGNLYELMGAVVFLGGFLFHMFWESSASYTIPYFVLLIPYAVCGMAEWTAFLERAAGRLRGTERIGDGEVRELPRRNGWREKPCRVLTAAAVCIFLLLVLAFTRTNLFHRTLALDDDLQGIDASAQFYQTGYWENPY
ncbi:MAG: hypothetical protein OSJ59_00615 [Lachnospiraceae bacterium]|nr:hypothetical protein [Lachnospiraceae bacterium]